MIRYQWHSYVKNGEWREFIMRRANRLQVERGFKPATFWGKEHGPANFFMSEMLFESLAEYEEVTKRLYGDDEMMDLLRRAVTYMGDTSEIHELLGAVPNGLS
ncbi:MAG: hypothetical protein M3R21_07640 [Candidatus Dormibacteraeota bacterium]|nr:hypothetical protein [Candidatus Dormibacteraeota bacterium]